MQPTRRNEEHVGAAQMSCSSRRPRPRPVAVALLEAIDDDMLAASLDDAGADRNASAAILVVAHSVQVGPAIADELRHLVVPARFGRELANHLRRLAVHD